MVIDISSLQVNCWCEKKIVWVAKEKILVGKTESCGDPDCKPES